MATFLLEFFLPSSGMSAGGTTASAIDVTTRIHHEAQRLTSGGVPVRLVQAISFQDDDLLQCVLDAPSPAAASALGRRAGLPYGARPERVDLLTLPDQRSRT